MVEKTEITFQMTVEDLEFLVFAMKFLEGGIEQETLRGYWQTVFERKLDEEFPVAEYAGLRITVEFLGGFKDGELLVSGLGRPEHERIMDYVHRSKGGAIGCRLYLLPDGSEVGTRGKKPPEAAHVYEIGERIERVDEMIIRFRYVGRADECD